MAVLRICCADDARDVARTFQRELGKRSVECRIDCGDEDDGGLTDADMLLLLSEEACREPSLRLRLEDAVRNDVRLFPVFVEDVELTDWMRFLISSHQWRELREGGVADVAGEIASSVLLSQRRASGGSRATAAVTAGGVAAVTAGGSAGVGGAFVGRRDEMAALRRALEPPGDGGPAGPLVVGIRGEAGIGKSRFATEYLGLLRDGASEQVVYRSAAAAGDSGLGYALWARLLLGIAGGTDIPGDVDGLADALEESLGVEVDRGGLSEACFLLPVALGEPVDAPTGIDGLRGRVAGFLAGLFWPAAAASGVTVFLDDMHWADDDSRALLRPFLEACGDSPLRVLLAYRPADPRGRPVELDLPESGVRAAEIALRPLDTGTSEQLLSKLEAGKGAAGQASGELLRAAGGNPLRLELLARLRSDSDGADIDVGLRDMLAERLRRMPEERRLILEALAVLGESAESDTVAALALAEDADGAAAVADDFAQTRSSGLGRTIAFRHALLRDAVYAAMEEGLRRQLHLRAAMTLERRYRGQPKFSGEVSFHWKAAGRLEAALEHAAAYLGHVNSIFSSSAALAWSEEVERLIGRVGLDAESAETLARALAIREETLGRAGRADEREAVIAELESLTREYGLIEWQAHAYFSRGNLLQQQTRYDEAVEWTLRAKDLAESNNLRFRVACALGNLGAIVSDFGDRLDEAEELYNDCLAIMKELGRKKDEGVTYMHLALLYKSLKRYDRARAAYDSALELAREIDHGHMEAGVLVNLAALEFDTGRPKRAQRLTDTALGLLRKAGDKRTEAIAVGNRANYLGNSGSMREALADYRRSIRLHRECGNRRSEEISRSNYAIFLYRCGLNTEALEQTDAAMELNRESGRSRWTARLYGNRGRILLEEGRVFEASADVERALRIGREKGYAGTECRALVSMAMIELWRKNLKRSAAIAAEAEARCLEEGDEEYTLAEARIVRGRALLERGRVAEASRCARELEGIDGTFGRPLILAAVLAFRAAVLERMGNRRQADELLGEAAGTADECGYGDLLLLRGTAGRRERIGLDPKASCSNRPGSGHGR